MADLNELETNTVASVHRALNILEFVAQNGKGVALTQIAAGVGLSVSTVHRLLKSVGTRGYIVQDAESKRYHLGPKLVDLWRTFSENLDLGSLAAPALAKLCQTYDETVNLAVMEAGVVVHVLRFNSTRRCRPKGATIENRNAHASALGKVLLAGLSDEALTEFLTQKGMARFTSRTIDSYEGLLRELASVREQGYALDIEESWEGICCVAAPVRNWRGEVIAAVGFVVPKERFVGDRVTELRQATCEVAGSISRELGYREGMPFVQVDNRPWRTVERGRVPI